MNFEPKILGFLCNWCSYAGADLAGVSRIQYPPNIRVIRVMCSGRVDPKFIFTSLQVGIDGIIVMGCHPGDCHYLEGNYEAEVKFKMVKLLLNLVDLQDRVHLEWVSASEGVRFGEVVTNFTESIKKLGPSPLSGENFDQHLFEKLKAIELAADGERLRALVARKRIIMEEGNIYGEKISQEDLDEILISAIEDEFLRQQILLKLKNEPLSVKDLSQLLNIDSSVILKHIISLKARNLIDYDKIEGITPFYQKL